MSDEKGNKPTTDDDHEVDGVPDPGDDDEDTDNTSKRVEI